MSYIVNMPVHMTRYSLWKQFRENSVKTFSIVFTVMAAGLVAVVGGLRM